MILEETSTRLFPAPILRARGLLLLFLSLCIPLASLFLAVELRHQIVALFLYAALLLALIFIDGVLALREVKKTKLRLDIPDRMFSGQSCAIVIHKGPSSLEWKLALAIPDTVEFISQESSKEPGRFLSKIRIKPSSRGEVEFSLFTTRVCFRHRFWHWQFAHTLNPSAKVLVLPNDGFRDDDVPAAFLSQLSGDKKVKRMHVEGREFDSLRLYYPGDDLRRVDWKRSSRTGKLLVKTYQPETHQRINIAVDCGRRTLNIIDGRLQIEHACDAAAHLLHIAGDCDDEIGLFAFHHKVLARHACRRGRAQEQLLRQSLTTLKPGDLESDYQLLTEWAGMDRRRSLLILITSFSNPSGLDAVAKSLLPVRSRHLVLICAIADRDIEELRYSSAGNLAEAYTIAASVEQSERIRQKAETLRRSGIEFIYCDAAQLAMELRVKYLELKLSGKL